MELKARFKKAKGNRPVKVLNHTGYPFEDCRKDVAPIPKGGTGYVTEKTQSDLKEHLPLAVGDTSRKAPTKAPEPAPKGAEFAGKALAAYKAPQALEAIAGSEDAKALEVWLDDPRKSVAQAAKDRIEALTEE